MFTLPDHFQNYIEIFSNPLFVCLVQMISLITLTKIITNLAKFRFSQKREHYEKMLFIFFIIPIVAVMIDNIFLIMKIFLPRHALFVRCLNCLAWIFSCIKFYCLYLFVEHLIHKKMHWNIYHKVFILFEFLLCIGFIANTINLILNNTPFYAVIFCYYILTLFAFFAIVFNIFNQITKHKLPIVLNKQLHTLLIYFLCPHFICILIELLPIILFNKPRIVAFSNANIILIAASLYFCFKKIMQFRFLNLSTHVQIKPDLKNVINFKEIIEHINIATTPQELTYISKEFCFEQCGIEKTNTTFYINNDKFTDMTHKEIQQFLNTDHDKQRPIDILIKHKILVAHEIEFDEFYTKDPIITLVSNFLRTLNADIFVPIIHNQQLLGAIIIHHNEEKILYSSDTQNTLMVFAQFLAPALYNMQHQNVLALLQECKEIKETLHEKHQEIAQYKESIKQLLKDRIEHHIGIIFCKGKQFHIKNQEAEKLLGFNPNVQLDHPATLTLINFAQKVEKFQTTSSMCLILADGQKLIISGMPQTHTQAGVLLVIRKPEATDLIKMHLDSLKNNSDRDYLLYLETTKVGQKINQLLPSSADIFINIKIQLLQATLQKSALFLQMHEDDVNATITILEQFDHNQQTHTVTLKPNENDIDHLIFGTNPLLSTNQEVGLLEKFNNATLVINNIEFLSAITQQKLAYFIRYGIFTPIKSEQRKFSNTRIICTTNHNLAQLHHEKIIISELFIELNKNAIAFPSLVTMPETQLHQLIDGFMYQHMQNDTNKSLRSLTQQHKQAIIDKRIASIFALQQKVYHVMSHTSEKPAKFENNPKKITSWYDANPEITRAAQLGKHALKDIQLMKTLWKQLGNQTKIADLLGVNRSSVNRRCKEYNLV